jgi:hypothetical protein
MQIRKLVLETGDLVLLSTFYETVLEIPAFQGKDFFMLSENRHWYPTDNKPAVIFPMEIEFENKGKEYLLKI